MTNRLSDVEKVSHAVKILQGYCKSPKCRECVFYREPSFYSEITCKINNPSTWSVSSKNSG